MFPLVTFYRTLTASFSLTKSYPRSTSLLFLALAGLWISTTCLQANPMAGSYTINAGSPATSTNFQSISAFASALSANGVSGHVTATIVQGSGPYTEQVVFSGISGLGSNATVTLNGSGETVTALTSSTDRHIIRLTEMSHFTLSHLRIEMNTSAPNGFLGIHLFNSGNHISVVNCEVIMNETTSVLNGGIIASGSLTSILTAGNYHNLTLEGNYTFGGGYGISVYGVVSPLASNIIIHNNQLFNGNSHGIYLRETDGAIVSNNQFDNTVTMSGTVNYIQVAQNANINTQIFNNSFQASNPQGGSFTLRCVYLFNGTGHKVYNNEMYNINAGGNFAGIEVRTASTFPEISHNTIALTGSGSSSGNLYGFKEELSNTGSVLRNNIFAISQSASGARAGIFLGNTSVVNSAITSDHNIFYIPGGDIARRGTTNLLIFSTLAAWQNASDEDENSLALDPEFVSVTEPIPTNPDADDAGTPVSYITHDIVGNARGVVPDIGAYEFGCLAPSTPVLLSGETLVCTGQQGVVYIAGSNPPGAAFQWTVPAGATIVSGQGTDTLVINFGTSGGDIAVSAVNVCGQSDTSVFNIEMTTGVPTGSLFISGITEVCPTVVAVYTATPLTNTSWYQWVVPSGSQILSGQGTSEIQVLFGPNAGSISVTPQNGCGNGTTSSLTITYEGEPLMPGSISGPVSICPHQEGVVYSISEVTGADSYHWEVPDEATIISGQGTTSITVDFGSQSGLVAVSTVNECGLSSPQTMTIDLDLGPMTPSAIQGPEMVCANEAGYVYSIDPVPGADSYIWTVPSGSEITSGQGSEAITVSFGSSPVSGISVIAVNECGESTPANLMVSFMGQPDAPVFIDPETEFCQGTNGVVFSVEPMPSVATYSWSVPLGSVIVSGQGTSTVTVNVGNAGGQVTVLVTGVCAGSGTVQSSINIDILPLPVVSVEALNNEEFCYGATDPYVLFGGTPEGGVYTGSIVNQDGHLDPALGFPGDYTITYTYTDENGCQASAVATVWLIICNAASRANEMPPKVFPNPAGDRVNVQIPDWPAPANIELRDAAGRLVQAFPAISTNSTFSFKRGNLPSGTYFLVFRIDNREMQTVSIQFK